MLLLFSIALLLILVLWVRLNAFLALTITAFCTGLAVGMPPLVLLKSIETGVGNTLKSLTLVLALGIIFGNILAETGAAQRISNGLLRLFGPKRADWALAVTSFVVGLALFYNAGFVVLAPLVFSVAAASGRNLVALGISMAAPLSVTHGFLPPHPGATNIANIFGADLGKTLLLGLCIAIPAAVLAGILFPKYFLKGLSAKPPEGLFVTESIPEHEQPGFTLSLAIALLPVLLMGVSAVMEMNFPPDSNALNWAKFWGDASVAMLLAVLLSIFLFSKNRWFNPDKSLTINALMEKSGHALGAASMLLLVIAAGGVFKQVLVDSGLGKDLAQKMLETPFSPLVLGWGIATLLRIALGSATVAGTTAAGIVLPMMSNSTVSPELMTLAVGAGSLMCSHVNDTGFWMFREWFGLSLKDTFKSWTLMETIVGIAGLIGVLILKSVL